MTVEETIDNILYHKLAEFEEVQGREDNLKIAFKHAGIDCEVDYYIEWVDEPPTKETDGMRLYRAEPTQISLSHTNTTVEGEANKGFTVEWKVGTELDQPLVNKMVVLKEDIEEYIYSEY